MNQTETEKNIHVAAEEVFLEKGYQATSMLDISRRANCNQALVYYYYRSKENLFTKIFSEKTELVFNSFADPLREEQDILDTIRTMVNAYFDFLSQNERLPYFVVNEIMQNPDIQQLIIDIFEKNAVRMGVFMQFDNRVREGVRSGLIRNIDSSDLMIHIVSLCVATFISKSMLTRVLTFNNDATNDYVSHRKQEIVELIIRGIKQ